MTFQEMKLEIQSRLKPARYNHVLGVIDTAEKLAQYLDIDEQKLKQAALLHDCAKYMDYPALIDFAGEHSISISEEDLRVPAVIHARVGAWMAGEQFGIKDTDILEAIAVHSAGRAGMGIYARALFVCDYIEPGRRLKNTEKRTKQAFTDFEKAVLAIIVDKTRWVLKQKRPLHQEGIDFYHDQLQRINS